MLGEARMGAGSVMTLGLGVLAVALPGCGQVSRDRGGDSLSAGGGAANGPTAGANTGGGVLAAGTGGVGTAGAGDAGGAAEEPVSCDADGNQVARDAQGVALPTGRRCTVKVVVDDETSIPCATKADGSYRCWADEGATPLPIDDYVQVQQGTRGFVALTRDGRIVAPDVPASPVPAKVIELTSTNMWGGRALCYRTDAAGPLTIWHPDYDPSIALPGELRREEAGPFEQALCAYEGIAYGVRPGGKIWDIFSDAEFGEGFAQIAANFHFVCGVKADRSLACANGWSPLAPTCIDGLAVSGCADPLAMPSPPAFPSGNYVQVAATWLTACAITTGRELVCVRGDGALLPSFPGRYTAVAAGGRVMCAIRVDGTTSCWEHATGQPLTSLTSFEAYRHELEADW